MTRLALLVVTSAFITTACVSSGPAVGDNASRGTDTGETEPTAPRAPAPEVPTGPLDPEVDRAVDLLIDRIQYEGPNEVVDRLVASGDVRVAWYLVDVLRFVRDPDFADLLIEAFADLTGVPADPLAPWSSAVDQLLVWDIPAPPGYFQKKERIFTIVDERWLPFFDPEADIDWRQVGWGGVFIDDRSLGDPNNCLLGCIPALDDPPVTNAAGGSWYPDDAYVFGVVINGEARAYPKNMMEVHEMVNDTLGGRRIALPYCTLCGSAQVYYTDDVVTDDGEPIVLRTSGLLIRSNKMMYELTTRSLIDTFRGVASSGPLREQGVQLEQESVITATWGEWKLAHPETTIIVEDGGRSRTYSLNPLRDRDADGPIFPIGLVDARLDVQEPVLGVVIGDRSVAFPVAEALEALRAGESVSMNDLDLELVLDGDGLRAVQANVGDGEPGVGSHQAFWFAWSQFHPDTELWRR